MIVFFFSWLNVEAEFFLQFDQKIFTNDLKFQTNVISDAVTIFLSIRWKRNISLLDELCTKLTTRGWVFYQHQLVKIDWQWSFCLSSKQFNNISVLAY